MPPKPKSKTAPNQHDKRHESGLAAPGKRVVKQRSNSNLNGLPNGKPGSTSSPPPPPLPSTGLNQGLRFSRSGTISTDSDSQPNGKDIVAAADVTSTTRDRTSSEASIMDAERGGSIDMASDSQDHSGHADTHAATCKLHGQSSLSSKVSTILVNYPLRDAISILILLLSLPTTLVLVIQTLFASLTFVPPTAGISISSLPNMKDIFNASNMGYPALATILIVDLLFWICWLPMWKPVQNIFLDLSQAVIAVSLSGAAVSSGGPTYSIVTCTLIVGMVHVLRYKAFHLPALDYIRSMLQHTDLGASWDAPSISSLFSAAPVERGWGFTVIRTILGLHIVSQGVTTWVRRSLVKANERDQQVSATSKTDSESTAGADVVQPDGVSSAAIADSRGGTTGFSGSRDPKSRESNSKRKKKQANQVRSQQPLWAAIASTKVTFVKEMEQRHAADDARHASAMEIDRTALMPGSMTTNSSDRIWISDVRDTDIFFSIDLCAASASQSADQMEAGVNVGATIDKSKPFYVRVNGASWSSTRIMSSATGEQSEHKDGGFFDGEIFGLTPLSSYHCEIIGIASGTVLCSASLITQPAPSAEQATAIPVQQQQSSLRPSSPITTLRKSILSAEAKLNETRNRTRKTKKDQKGVHSDIRKEINSLRSKLESSGGLDDKQERRLMQINQHKMQAEEATAEIKGQIEALGEIPSAEVAIADSKQRAWRTALDLKKAANREFDDTRAEADREMSVIKADIAASESKREKVSARNVQRGHELEKLIAKQQADTAARHRREQERGSILRAREEEESNHRFHIATMNSEIDLLQQKTHDAYQQIANLQNWSNQPPPAYPGYTAPPTPEGALPGTNGTINAYSNGFAPNSVNFGGPFPTQSPGNGFKKGVRGRSSSMLSQYSGFTEDGDEYEMPPTQPWPMIPHASSGADDRNGSDGSASKTNGSTGSSSPHPEGNTLNAARKSPIAPPHTLREREIAQSSSSQQYNRSVAEDVDE